MSDEKYENDKNDRMDPSDRFWLGFFIILGTTLLLLVVTISAAVVYHQRMLTSSGYEEVMLPSSYTKAWQKKAVE